MEFAAISFNLLRVRQQGSCLVVLRAEKETMAKVA
jgi:hypothetical protein